MAGVYFYVPTGKIRDIIDCGIKLSEWYDRELELPGQGFKKVIRALVNPWDDILKSKDPAYRCLRLEVNPDSCMVGDTDLYHIGQKEQAILERYRKTLVSLSEYRFGLYRNPECLVFTSILPDHIEVTGKVQDIPVLFENSKNLYSGNIMDSLEEGLQDSGNTLVYAYCRYIESVGGMRSLEDKELGLTLFIDTKTDAYIVTRIP